jgi:hypothetical protein
MRKERFVVVVAKMKLMRPFASSTKNNLSSVSKQMPVIKLFRKLSSRWKLQQGIKEVQGRKSQRGIQAIQGPNLIDPRLIEIDTERPETFEEEVKDPRSIRIVFVSF